MGRRKRERSKKRRQVIDLKPPGLYLPRASLILPKTPFENRMSTYSFRIPPEGTPEAARLKRRMEADASFQTKLKEMARRLPHLAMARVFGASGLPMSKLLRWYFVEYLNRFTKFGPESLPTSFNVVESFMRFDREYMYFDLHNEVDHLLAMDDYFRWYGTADMPKDPSVLVDVLPQGEVFSYNMITDATGVRIHGVSQQVLAGVSYVRHEHELSCILLAGENPPPHSDEEILKLLPNSVSAPGREGLKAAPDLTVSNRYLDGYPGFARVIIMTRFDLVRRKHDVRYVFLDFGPSFRVLTDDTTIFEDIPPAEVEGYRNGAIGDLGRYDDLFAALASMIYLPVFFTIHRDRIQNHEVATALYSMRDEGHIKQTLKEVGEGKCVSHRSIRCMPATLGLDDDLRKNINPPDLQFQCDGYWKAIGPLEIGEDKEGTPIIGKTWVSRNESWSARSPTAFLLEPAKSAPTGPDPGAIYVQRSPANETDIYKVGLTRRSPEVRAGELSSATGVALPLLVVAKWEVGDCARVEHIVHERLAAFRINPRREFFRADLSHICQVINRVVAELPG